MPELSGVEVSVLVKEIGERLRGTYVNNIYSVGEAQIFRFRQPGGEDAWLLASPRYGAWISEKVAERAATTEFTTGLRQELSRARVQDAAQVDLDRVFVFAFEAPEEEKRLVVEMMPPGNIVVLGPKGVVRLALRESRSSRRSIVKGAPYSPPSQGRLSPADVTPEDVRAMLASETTVGKAIGRNLALPRKYIRALLLRLSVQESTPSSEVLPRAEEVSEAVKSLVSESGSNPEPCVCETPDGPDVFARPPPNLVVMDRASSMSELCDTIFLPMVLDDAEKAAAPAMTQRGEIEKTLERLAKEGEGLLAQAKEARSAASAALAAGSLDDSWSIASPLLPSGRAPRSRPASQAAIGSLLFDRAKELERRADEVGAASRTLQRRLSKAKSPPGKRNRPIRRAKQEWFEKFRWFYTSGGKLAIGGRDAQSNTLLVRRHSESNDTVYHADLFGSPFFILKNGKDQTAEEVQELAQATVGYSSAWKTGLGAADAYWVAPEQVSSSAPSGEFLARGSFMIKGKKNMVQHVPVQLAVGVDKEGRVVSGPESAIRRVTKEYALLTPYKEKSSDTAKKVIHELDLRAAAPSATIDDVLRALPAGGGKVVRRKVATEAKSDKQ